MSKNMIEINENKSVTIWDDGQVVVTNDNARIDAKETTSRIEGHYLIDADSVLKLLALQNDKSFLRVNSFMLGRTSFFSATKSDVFDAKIKEIKEYIEKELPDAKKYIDENNNLKTRIRALERQIEDFNLSRHWWERKLTIK